MGPHTVQIFIRTLHKYTYLYAQEYAQVAHTPTLYNDLFDLHCKKALKRGLN